MLKRLFASNKRPCFRAKGPWEKRVFDLSGCKLEITMPPHDFEFPEEDHGNKFNVFDVNLYDYDADSSVDGRPPREGISYPGIFLRKWESFGPIWRSRPIGFMQASLVVCDTSRMNTDLNCFNLEHMERLIRHVIYYSDGPGFSTKREARSPVEWHVKTLGGHDFVYYESWPKNPAWNKQEDLSDESTFIPRLIVPVFEDKYLIFAFSVTGSLPAIPSIKLMRDRIDKIISSITLQLSPEANEQKEVAQKKFPNTEYSSRREPEDWKYYGSFRDGDILAGEKSIVFEGECSPPPSLD